MNQRAMINLEVEKGDRTFVFSMPVGSPYGEAYDAAFEILSEIQKMSSRAVENAKQPEAKEEVAKEEEAKKVS